MTRNKEAIRSAAPLSRVIAEMTGRQPRKRGRELVRPVSTTIIRASHRRREAWRQLVLRRGKGGDVFRFVME